MKLLEENIGEMLQYSGSGKDSLNKNPKPWETKTNTDKLN
jgi:hypothetical protein